MMQFMWRYVDDLIGKGLSMEILARFFWHMGITLVPMALPLSILLTSLISFGNMGENLELTALKSAGVPLVRIMMPMILLCTALGFISFDFQNNISPKAQKQLMRMLVTMKETSPALEIPEGVFYNGIPNINIYVKTKDTKTGMLYDVIIYKMDQGFENAQIVVADSARLQTTADKHFLKLAIFSGEQFENLQSAPQMTDRINVPYDRETFREKTLLINFDSGFNMLSEGMFNDMARVKNLVELKRGADSISLEADSIGRTYYLALNSKYIINPLLAPKDSAKIVEQVENKAIDIKKLYEQIPPEKRLFIIQAALGKTKQIRTDLEWQEPVTSSDYLNVRKHMIEWHQKFALAFACIIFFFIGAPLGAIIRKGGLGMPTVISVIIFIFYYIINTSGMKLAKEGTWSIWFGLWISTIIMAPFGVFLTYKANNDSVVFNLHTYLTAIRRFFGIKTTRLFLRKEVIIEKPNYATERDNIKILSKKCNAYIRKEHLPIIPNYFRLFFFPLKDNSIENISQEMEYLLQRLSNSNDAQLLTIMNDYPELNTTGHQTPFKQHGTNIVIGLLFPIGLCFAWRIWKFRIQLFRNLKTIVKTNNKMLIQIDKILSNN